MPKKTYYFDYAATTPLDPQVFSAMLPYLKEEFGNPSNLYELSRKANQAVIKATAYIAGILGCRPDEFIYTGSATEADNLAILGTASKLLERDMRSIWERKQLAGHEQEKPKIIVSSIEHKGILAVCDVLEKEGFEIVRLPVLKNGLVDLNEFKKELDERTILVSITMADSETGTIQPITEISDIIRNFRNSKHEARNSKLSDFDIRISDFPLLHTDASQASKYLDINVEKLGVDLMTLSAHKIYGPKGIGGLYVRKGTKINPIIYGGGQQDSLRSGTENVPGIVAFAKALSLCKKYKRAEALRIKKLRDALEKGIFKLIPKAILNGHPTNRLPNFLNISILDVEGEAALLYLDRLGIMVSTGSACNSQNLEPSYILKALGNSYEHIHGSLRFTLGKQNTMRDIKYVLKHLPIIVKKLRSISSLNLSLNQKKWQNKIKK